MGRYECGRTFVWVIRVLVVVAGTLGMVAGTLVSEATAPTREKPAATSPPPGTGMTVDGTLRANTSVSIIRVDGETFIAGVGERVGDAVVVSIDPNKVVMKKGGIKFGIPASPIKTESPKTVSPPVSGAARPEGTPPPRPLKSMIVTGILGDRTRVAIIQTGGATFVSGVGERAGDAVVVSILPNKVGFKKGNATFELPVGVERSL
jgi:flagellar biogenesis protein FliO